MHACIHLLTYSMPFYIPSYPVATWRSGTMMASSEPSSVRTAQWSGSYLEMLLCSQLIGQRLDNWVKLDQFDLSS